MLKLIHVVRGVPDHGISFNLFDQGSGNNIRLNRGVAAIHTASFDEERDALYRVATFMLVDERDVEVVLRYMAEINPGHEVRVYALEQVAQCPAAPMVVKKVTQHGVLPS